MSRGVATRRHHWRRLCAVDLEFQGAAFFVHPPSPGYGAARKASNFQFFILAAQEAGKIGGVKLEFVEGAEAFDAVEFFGGPVYGVFEDGEAVAGRLQQDLLGRRVEIGWSAVD